MTPEMSVAPVSGCTPHCRCTWALLYVYTPPSQENAGIELLQVASAVKYALQSPGQSQCPDEGSVLKEELLMSISATHAPQHVASSNGSLEKGSGWAHGPPVHSMVPYICQCCRVQDCREPAPRKDLVSHIAFSLSLLLVHYCSTYFLDMGRLASYMHVPDDDATLPPAGCARWCSTGPGQKLCSSQCDSS